MSCQMLQLYKADNGLTKTDIPEPFMKQRDTFMCNASTVCTCGSMSVGKSMHTSSLSWCLGLPQEGT